MIAAFSWLNFHIKCFKFPIVLGYFSSSLCILLTLQLVMSLTAEIKSDSTKSDSATCSQMSEKEVASPLASSEGEAVVPQSLGEQWMDVEESEGQRLDERDVLTLEERKTENDALGNKVGTCESRNPTAAEIVTHPCNTGENAPPVSSLEDKQTHKDTSEQEEPHHASSGPASDDVCASEKDAGCSAEIEVCSSKEDAQESINGVGKLTVKSPQREKNPTVEEGKANEESEVKPDHNKLEIADDDLVQPVAKVAGTKPEEEGKEKVTDKHPESDDEDDADDEDDVLMGYHFNEDDVLVDKNGKQFEYCRYKNHSRNQKRYEKLGEKINDYVYRLLETRCKLKKVYIPLDAKKEEPRSFIFVSEDAFKTEDKLIIFIHGSGVVRAGQWARSLIINHSLRNGTQIPHIMKALKDGYEVIVLNTNLNSLSKSRWPSADELIRGSEDPESHAIYVWENLIEKEVKAKRIAIIAHSYGGVVTKKLVSEKHDQFSKRVFAIAFTDSVHGLHMVFDSPAVIQFFREHARNWVTSVLPLDERVNGQGLRHANDALRVSAGHEKHEWTSWSSFDSVFKFLDDEYRSFVNKSDEDSEAQKPTANL